jgi:Rrf2 family protein
MNSRFAVSMHILTILASRGEVLTSERIAEMIGTNPAVVRRLAQTLLKAGYVQSKLGPGGGLKMAMNPSEITLGCVFRMTKEEPMVRNIPKDKCGCAAADALERTISAATEQAETAFFNALSKRTLQDVLEQAVHLEARVSSAIQPAVLV